VPFVVLPFASIANLENFKIKAGSFGLTNIASTVCDLLGLPYHESFNESILERQ
jgi:hypothetical protein